MHKCISLSGRQVKSVLSKKTIKFFSPSLTQVYSVMFLNDLLVQTELMPSAGSSMIIPQYFIDAESSATVAMGAARSKGSRTARITGL